MSAKSTTRDMTTGSIWKHIVLFSIPLLIGNLFQQLYNTVDSVVVGNFVSNQALGAVDRWGRSSIRWWAFLWECPPGRAL